MHSAAVTINTYLEFNNAARILKENAGWSVRACRHIWLQLPRY